VVFNAFGVHLGHFSIDPQGLKERNHDLVSIARMRGEGRSRLGQEYRSVRLACNVAISL
jgi:hypothetical protein